jgi:hypothetical protein
LTKGEKLMRALMFERGIKTVGQLHRMLLYAGYEIGYGAVQGAIKHPGKVRNHWLVEAICGLFGLSDEEMLQVTMATTYTTVR